jgi:phosphohistidine swiveling domain-containing protein
MKWKFIVKRKLSILFLELINMGQTKTGMKKNLGLSLGFANPYRSVEGGVYYTIENLKKAKDVFKNIYSKKGSKIFKTLLKKWNNSIKNLKKVSLEISKKDYSDKTNEELIKEFEKLEKAYYKPGSALMAPLTIGEIAEEEIRKKLEGFKDEEEYFRILTASEIETEGTKELKSMLKIAIKLKQGKDISFDIKEHIKEFGWINTRGFYENEWSEKEIRERLNSMLEEDLKERLNRLDKDVEEIKKNTEKILSEVKADKEFKELVYFTKELVYFRTQRMDIYVKAGFLARPLFKEIAKRFDLEMHDIFCLTSDEIKDALKNKKDFTKEINKRKQGFGFFINKNDKISVLTGKELEEYKKKYVKEEIKKDIKELKGRMASAGYAKGTVKILSGTSDLNKVKKGDILVASMTTPDFVPAMEKAAAFVTDEGGILCHAAIVSREMNKPCIIGTKIATQVLKDGDLVEVDADNGIIKIIKRK